ncbi:YcxB family protein [Streptomyces sp. SAS_270]|uniref:YcxB family protein n=1 Tax=Streptomyces sp. SAS_270 TaxID=3412748 RepID=UPI00403CC3AC
MADGGGDGDGDRQSVELVYVATAGEFREAFRAHAKASAAGRLARRLLLGSAGLGILVGAVPLFLGGTVRPMALAMPGAALLGLVVLPWLQAHHFHRRAAARGEHRTLVDGWGVRVTTDRGAGTMTRWAEVKRCAETRRTFVLLDPASPVPVLLPKRGAPTDVARLRSVLDRNLARRGSVSWW